MDAKRAVNSATKTPSQGYTYIKLKGVRVETSDDTGTVLKVPCQTLSDIEESVLNRLFPTFQNQIGRLLSKETVLAVMEDGE